MEEQLHNADELVPNMPIKQEQEWLPDDQHAPHGANHGIDSLEFIKPEAESSSAAEFLAVPEFTPIPQTQEFIKTELLLEEDFLEGKNDSEAGHHAQPKQEVVLEEDDDEKARVSIAGEEWEICEFCYKLYPKGCMEAHMNESNCREGYQCELCPRSFAAKANLTQHSRIHDQNTYQCQFCSRYFKEKMNLIRHSKSHDEKTYQCGLCPRSFMSITYLTRHTKMIHVESQPENFACELCGLACLYKEDLIKHLVTHSKEIKAAFSCNLCDKSFDTIDGLNKHVRLHTGDSHDCDLCGARFSGNADLKRHIVILHTGKKSRTCNICGKSFKNVSKRKKHTCDPNRLRYKCDFCDKTYANKSSLAVHTNEHTGLPWKCGICEKKFTLRDRCRHHIIRVHKITDNTEAKGLIQKVPKAEEL